jgi:hypothetical protein
MKVYTATQIVEMIQAQYGREVSTRLVRRSCTRLDIGTLLNPRMRVIEEADLQTVIDAVLAAKVGNPNFGQKKIPQSRVEKTKASDKSRKKSKKKA